MKYLKIAALVVIMVLCSAFAGMMSARADAPPAVPQSSPLPQRTAPPAVPRLTTSPPPAPVVASLAKTGGASDSRWVVWDVVALSVVAWAFLITVWVTESSRVQRFIRWMAKRLRRG